MYQKFDEKLKVIKNYGNSDHQEIYEYKVQLHVYDTYAVDKGKSQFPQLSKNEGSRNGEEDPEALE